MKRPCVYILTNKSCSTLYTGVTSNLPQRIWQHKNKSTDGFAKKYNLDKLVWYEVHNSMYQAISREKQLKSGNRQRKINLIEADNPKWKDLYFDIEG